MEKNKNRSHGVTMLLYIRFRRGCLFFEIRGVESEFRSKSGKTRRRRSWKKCWVKEEFVFWLFSYLCVMVIDDSIKRLQGGGGCIAWWVLFLSIIFFLLFIFLYLLFNFYIRFKKFFFNTKILRYIDGVKETPKLPLHFIVFLSVLRMI